MRADGVLLAAPGFDQNLGLVQRVEYLTVQKFGRTSKTPGHDLFPRVYCRWLRGHATTYTELKYPCALGATILM